jgi:hypothetical protein
LKELYISDSIGIPITKIIKYKPRTSNPGLSVPISPLYYYEKNIRFLEFGVDTLNTLKNDKLEPFAIFNLGNLKMDTDPFMPINSPDYKSVLEHLKQKLWLDKIYENNRYLFLELDFGLSDSSMHAVFIKQTQETFFINNKGFENDFDGGLTFWPKYVYNDSILVDYCEAYVLLNHIRSGDSKKLKEEYGDRYLQLEKAVSVLDVMSNPILIILKSR